MVDADAALNHWGKRDDRGLLLEIGCPGIAGRMAPAPEARAARIVALDEMCIRDSGYPPTASSYTYSNIPVILGEYGSLTDSTSFYADVESKQIPNLAWDFDPYSNCAPDLVNVTTSATTLTPTTWGMTVRSYLMDPP